MRPARGLSHPRWTGTRSRCANRPTTRAPCRAPASIAGCTNLTWERGAASEAQVIRHEPQELSRPGGRACCTRSAVVLPGRFVGNGSELPAWRYGESAGGWGSASAQEQPLGECRSLDATQGLFCPQCAQTWGQEKNPPASRSGGFFIVREPAKAPSYALQVTA